MNITNLFSSEVQRQRERDEQAAKWRQFEKVLNWQAYTIRSENAYNLARAGAERHVVDKDEIQADYYELSYIIISLDVWDTYNMRFLNRSGNLVQNVNSVDASEMHNMITKYTGLYTSL